MNEMTVYVENDNEFYPTPEILASKMIHAVDLEKCSSILEPSAGKGDLCEAVRDLFKIRWYHNSKDAETRIDCIEIDPNLRHILTGKGWRVVHDDFLSFHTHKHYDLILMNPPFSNGDEHLLKALDLQRDGGAVVCLLNAETLRNPYTKRRQLLLNKLLALEAKIEYIENAFSSAERKTPVSVALVTVKIPPVEHNSFIFDDLQKKTYAGIDTECKDLVGGDYIAQILKSYELEIECGIAIMREFAAMQPHILSSFDENAQSILSMTCAGATVYNQSYSAHKGDATINNYVEAVRMKYWRALFHDEKFTGRLTSNLQNELYNKVSTLKDYDFSIYNIRVIQDQIMQQMTKGVEDAILSLFDELSAKHSWYPECAKNIHYYNGWASNKAHKINKKVIIPLNGAFADWGDTNKIKAYRVYEVLKDIEKALVFLERGVVETSFGMSRILDDCEREGQSKNIKLHYFTIDLYKKGTCHIKFCNQALLDKLNIYGSRKKGWLPPVYGKTHYADMSDQERAVIDEFQGAEEYEKVLEKANYYLSEPKPDLPMLTDGKA